jgi:hypothetical protein
MFLPISGQGLHEIIRKVVAGVAVVLAALSAHAMLSARIVPEEQ